MMFKINQRGWMGLSFLFLPLFLSYTQAQTSSEIYHELLKLKETKRILYLAAHPDDENTRLIAYLANREHAQVAYLSLTRGDGGQNLIGKELGIELGMIRTQELLRARETDGGKQFFSRAIDFGYSRNPEETLNNWEKEKLLSDVVWIIRKFQPDLIITRFNTTPGTTHGHHTTSAILAEEAFEISDKPGVFPNQLTMVDPWKAKRVFWNAYSWAGEYEPKEGKLYYSFPVGEYNPLLGTTYSQIAADSRTMHKSQGFGATAQIGESMDFMELVTGEKFEESPFEGIENRWETIGNGKDIEIAIGNALEQFDFLHPSRNLPALIQVKNLLEASPAKEAWVKEKKEAIDELFLQVLGIKAEFLSNKELSYPSDDINARLIINNPSEVPVNLSGFTVMDQTLDIQEKLVNNQPFTKEISIILPKEYPISQPYWLIERPADNLYTIEDQKAIGMAFNQPAVSGMVRMEIEGHSLEIEIPLRYKYNDQVDGEIIQPFTLVPQISLSINKENVFLLNNITEEIKVEVNFEDEIQEGRLNFEGLAEEDYEIIDTEKDGGKNRVIYTVHLKGTNGSAKESIVKVQYHTKDGDVYDKGKRRISYNHIPNLTYFPPSEFKLVQLQLNLSKQKIGYIPGAGDEVPGVLANLGYEVDILENGNYALEKLQNYSTIIVGIRAFNVNQSLANNVDQLMAYVYEGGNLIVQYNTISPLLTKNLGPYPFQLSRDRITVEDSPVKIDFNAHPVVKSPNKIEQRDFEGWVQERGLYFPGSWDEQYVAPLQMQDPNEAATQGALLVANYGKGTYTYSGISWFRLLPAGVPGAIKLFVNLIEQAVEKE